ncbi:MAG TPA: ABC transporter permease [Candidatus Binatia bacterium]|nr:ABC transporter permease [Candidatus Binatia bacterium]
MLAVFENEMRLLGRDRLAVVWMLLGPVIVITLVVAARYEITSAPLPLLPVVNEDQGPVARAFVKLLSQRARVVEIDLPEAERMVRDEGRAGAAIVFPEGLSKRYLQGRSSELVLLTDPAEPVDVRRVQVFLLLAGREAAELADPVGNERIHVVERNLTGRRLTRQSHEQNVPGFAIMFTLLAVVFGTAESLRSENDWGTTARLLIAPVGYGRVLLAKLGARMVVGAAQLLVLLLWGNVAFGISLGTSRVALVLVVVACAFGAVSLAMLVAGIAGSSAQVLPLALAFVLLMSAVAGLWWPITSEPPWMQRVAELVFPTWAMRALTNLVLRDRGLAAVVTPVLVTLAESAAVLAVGMHLFRAGTTATR